jgi:hypothetical protein
LSESEFVQVVFIVCLYLYYIRGPIIKTIDFAGKTWNIFYRNVNQVPTVDFGYLKHFSIFN